MKVLHLPMEIAGQVGLICRELRQSGVEAVAYNWRDNYLQYPHEVQYSDAYEMINTLETATQYFDIFHYHTGYTLFKDKSDLQYVHEAGKKIVMHHRGNDVRMASKAVQGKYGFNFYVNTKDSQPEEQIIRNLKIFSRYVSDVIVQDYELYDYVEDYYERVHVLPRLFAAADIRPPRKRSQAHRPLVVHAPTSRAFKGTEYIEGTVQRLKREINFDFRLIEKQSLAATRSMIEEADIVIDQVLCGMYGNVSVEGMGKGKPVICYIRPDIAKRLPKSLPIVSANPETLYEALKALLLDAEWREWLGHAGNHFVRHYHDAGKVVKQLIAIYQSLFQEK